MNLNGNQYIQTILAAAPAGQVYNDAAAYDVTIEPAQVAASHREENLPWTATSLVFTFRLARGYMIA